MTSEMFNPFEGPFARLQKKVIEHIKSESVTRNMMTPAQDAFEAFLREEHVVLTRSEKRRLFQATMKAVLGDMLANL